MKIHPRVEKYFTEEFFAKYMRSVKDVQELFEKLERMHAKDMLEYYRYYSKKDDMQAVSEAREKVEEIRDEYNALKKVVEQIQDPDLLYKYKKKLLKCQGELLKLQKLIEDFDVSKYLMKLLNVFGAYSRAELVEEYIKRVGAWFEKGAVGEGKVKIWERTYTYQKQEEKAETI
jgi:hypothetical protein